MNEIKISPDLLKELKKEAKKDNKSLNSYIENLLSTHPDRTLKLVKIINLK